MKTERSNRANGIRFGVPAVLFLALAFLSGFASPVQGQANPPEADQPTNRNLGTRYLFQQSFGGPAPALSQYQVAFRETKKETSGRAQGAPHRSEFLSVARYTEKPVDVGPIDNRMVSSVVRKYDQADVKPAPYVKPGAPPWLSRLTLWIKPRPQSYPEILVLNPPQMFLEEEYEFAASATPFYPNLALLLPTQEAVGLDRPWPVPALAVEALVGGLPVLQGSAEAVLKDVRPPAPGANEQVAVIGVTGRLVTDDGLEQLDTQLNAEIEFTFTPAAPDPNQPADAPVNALGGISQVRRAATFQSANRSIEKNMVLQCRWPGNGPVLTAPPAPPRPSPENSWLTWIDEKGRFTFSYPQSLAFKWSPQQKDQKTAIIRLIEPESDGTFIQLEYFEGEQPRPDDIFQGFMKQFREELFTVRDSLPEKIDTQGWASPSAAVQHLEAKLTDREGRQFMREFYVVQFTKNATLVVVANTTSPEIQAFRTQIESILKTFRLGTPPLQAQAAP